MNPARSVLGTPENLLSQVTDTFIPNLQLGVFPTKARSSGEEQSYLGGDVAETCIYPEPKKPHRHQTVAVHSDRQDTIRHMSPGTCEEGLLISKCFWIHTSQAHMSLADCTCLYISLVL